jgi:protein-tyrosine-phosphatase
VINEYEELVRSLVTERFTRWQAPSTNGVHVKSAGYPSADMDATRTSATARISARIHHDETSTTERSDR